MRKEKERLAFFRRKALKPLNQLRLVDVPVPAKKMIAFNRLMSYTFVLFSPDAFPFGRDVPSEHILGHLDRIRIYLIDAHRTT